MNPNSSIADFPLQNRGWEPAAVLNWLILCGWGVIHSSPAPKGSSKSRLPDGIPDSTKIMTLDEMINQVRMRTSHIQPLTCFLQFDISAVTHRNTSLEASKLEYINKHHLMRAASTDTGIQALAERAQDQIKKSFPGR